jgi:hypothetical protein
MPGHAMALELKDYGLYPLDNPDLTLRPQLIIFWQRLHVPERDAKNKNNE